MCIPLHDPGYLDIWPLPSLVDGCCQLPARIRPIQIVPPRVLQYLLRLQEIFSNVQHYMLRAVTTAPKRSRQAQIADDEDSLKHRPATNFIIQMTNYLESSELLAKADISFT